MNTYGDPGADPVEEWLVSNRTDEGVAGVDDSCGMTACGITNPDRETQR